MKTNELKKQVVNALAGDKESIKELLSFAGYDYTRYVRYTYKVGYEFTPSAGLIDKVCKKITDAGCKSVKMYIYKSKLQTAKKAKEDAKKRAKDAADVKKQYRTEHPFYAKEAQLEQLFISAYRISINYYLNVHYAVIQKKQIQDIKVDVYTTQNWDKARACKAYKWSTTEYNYTLQVPARYNYAIIGGLLTFWHGKLDRKGVKCSWIEQGRGVSEFVVRTGYLVRGEHIAAKTLQQAQKISAEHRAQRLSVLLATRRKKIETDKLLSATYCTVADSIAAGNCMPGTQNFCNKLFADLGKEVEKITLAELRKYGKKFGVETYAERVIAYKLSRI